MPPIRTTPSRFRFSATYQEEEEQQEAEDHGFNPAWAMKPESPPPSPVKAVTQFLSPADLPPTPNLVATSLPKNL